MSLTLLRMGSAILQHGQPCLRLQQGSMHTATTPTLGIQVYRQHLTLAKA